MAAAFVTGAVNTVSWPGLLGERLYKGVASRPRSSGVGRKAERGVVMATIIDASGQVMPLDLDLDNHVENPLLGIQETICNFMNQDHLGDLIQYVHTFSDMLSEEAMEEVTQVELYQVDQFGLSIEVVLCGKDDERCVCLRPKVPWHGKETCESVDDVLYCLAEMSQRCGLPAP